MKKILMLMLVIVALSSCGSIMNAADNGKTITLTGRVEKLGLTPFRYGSHSIKMRGQVYSIKSSSINLDNYLDRQVIIKGNKVPGYPLEGGPELIEVTDIKGQ